MATTRKKPAGKAANLVVGTPTTGSSATMSVYDYPPDVARMLFKDAAPKALTNDDGEPLDSVNDMYGWSLRGWIARSLDMIEADLREQPPENVDVHLEWVSRVRAEMTAATTLRAIENLRSAMMLGYGISDRPAQRTIADLKPRAQFGEKLSAGGKRGRERQLKARLRDLVDDMREDGVDINPQTVLHRLQKIAKSGDATITEVDRENRVHWKTTKGHITSTALKSVMDRIRELLAELIRSS